MSRKVRENILVTKGNLPIFPGGSNVFSCPHPIYGGPTIVPLDGQLVVYDNFSGVSLDAVSVLGRPFITVATAHDTNRDGVSDVLTKAFGDKIFGDFVSAFTAEPARCAIQEVVDLLISCTHCDTPYTVSITVEDNETQNQFPYNRPESFTFTTNEQCCGCDGCPDTSDVSCRMIQDLVKQINGVLTTNPLKVPTFSRKVPKGPFTAVRLYGGVDASQTWCFTPIKDDCGGCSAVPFIKSFTYDLSDGVGGIANPQTLVFTNNANPADATQTLIGQLSGIARQINMALNGKGSAILTRGVGMCCPINLEINTCATGVDLLTTADAVITPCGTSNPLAPVDDPTQCVNCGDQTALQTTYTMGVRIIADDVTIPYTRDGARNQVKGVLWRKLNVYPSNGFACGGTFVRKTQVAQAPEGLGYQWTWREYAAQPGGSGREYQPYLKTYGPLQLQGSETRASYGFVDPAEDYCPYIIEHGLPHTNTGVSDAFRVARGRTIILVPQDDTVTQASVESVIGVYIQSANNPVTQSALCSIDQDQIQNTGVSPNIVEGYPDANGFIY